MLSVLEGFVKLGEFYKNGVDSSIKNYGTITQKKATRCKALIKYEKLILLDSRDAE